MLCLRLVGLGCLVDTPQEMATTKPDSGPIVSPRLEPSGGSLLADAPEILVKDLERTPHERRPPLVTRHPECAG